MDDAGQHRFRPIGASSVSTAVEDASRHPKPVGPTALVGSPETPNGSGAGSPNGCKGAALAGDTPGLPPAARSADGEGASSRCSAPLLRLARQLRTLDQDPAWRRYADPTAPTPRPSVASQAQDASQDASREALEQVLQALSRRLVAQNQPPLPKLVRADADKLARLHVLVRMLSAELDRAPDLRPAAVPVPAAIPTLAPSRTAQAEMRAMEPPKSGASRRGFALAVALASAVMLLRGGVAVDRMVPPGPYVSQPRPTEVAAAPPREAAIRTPLAAPLAATTSQPKPLPHPVRAEIPPAGTVKPSGPPPHALRAVAPGTQIAGLPQAASPAPPAQRTAIGPPGVAASGSPAGIPAHPAVTAPAAAHAAVPVVATPAATPAPAPTAALPAAVAARTPAGRPARPAVSGPAPAPTAAPVTAAPVVVRFTGDSWIHVLDPTGKVVLSRLMHAGESWTPPAPGLLLTTGNAGATELVVNGVAAPPLGGTGTVLHLVPLDPARPRRGTISSATAKPG